MTVSMGHGPRIAASRRQRASRKGRTHGASAGTNGFVRLSAGSFAAGVACGAITVLALIHLLPRLTADAAGVAIADEQAAIAEPAQPALTYEFIHRLPREEVVTRLKNYEPPADAAAERDLREYLLQAASFRSREDADTVRARLMLEGMDVAVESVPQRSGGVWHRVLVGPFATRPGMERARTRLRELDYPALAVERTPGGRSE